jgi:hypothetical protein
MSTATVIGSAWDVGTGCPEAALPRHLAEWVAESACQPALAAANVQTIAGSAVLEALAGDRLAQLGGHASQYATGSVARLLRPLEPLAAAGGWWCSGLDPLADWAPMAWGTFKPDAPRWDQERNRHRKYEHPLGVAARLFWLRVPAVVAQLVADRHGLELPPEVAADATGDAGAFWRWWAAERRLPLLIAEGPKGAGALLSIGLPAVGVPGIWNPSPKNPATGRPELHPDLAALPLQDRPVWVLFDHPKAGNRNPDEPKAARRLGRLLAAAGAEVLVGTCPGPDKGADDALAAGVPWETLAAALQPLAPEPALPQLRHPDLIAPDGTYLGRAVRIPADRRVVAFAAAMGTGKTELIAQHLAPLMAAGLRVVLITHRRSLGEALAKRLGLPWADEAAPGSDLRQTGVALCVDSACPGSRLRINPADWAGCVVVMDEATAVMAHALMATGTAIARRRVPVLQTLAQLLAGASLVLAADAQLDNATLEAIEAAAGERAYLIGSEHRPAAGRQLITHSTRGEWFAALGQHLRRRERVWISTTAAERDAANSAQNLAVWVAGIWRDARALVVDADTVADPDHDASRLATDPNGIASRYDVVICTPAVAAGLSVDKLPGYFAAVFIAAGGTTNPGAVAQAAARVRDGCPRHLYAPQRSPGNALQIGCGSPCPDRVLLQLNHHQMAAIGQLAAAGWSATTNSAGPWLQLWAQIAAHQNRARLAFAATVAGLLEREGYAPQMGQTLPDAKPPEMLKEIAQAERDAKQERVIAAEVLTDQQARELQERRKRLSPAERAQLQRWRIDRAWGLQGAAPSPELIEAHEQGTHRAVVLRWALTDPTARPVIEAHDREQARQLAPDGRTFAPDLVRDLIGPRLDAAAGLGLGRWLERREWFAADDPALLQLAAATAAYGDGITQVLGIRPGKRATTALRQLLALVGARLECRRSRSGEGREAAAGYRYRVVLEPLPDRINPDQVVAAWRQHYGGCVPKSAIQKGMGSFGTPPQPVGEPS